MMRVWGAGWVATVGLVPLRALACPGCAPVDDGTSPTTLFVLGALAMLPVGLLALGAVGLLRAARHDDRGEGSHAAASLE